MHDFGIMEMLNCKQKLEQPFANNFLGEKGPFLTNLTTNMKAQVPLFTKLFNQIDVLLLDDEFVEGDNVGMFYGAHQSDFVKSFLIVEVDLFCDIVMVFIVSNNACLF